jgi:hypothetical protein
MSYACRLAVFLQFFRLLMNSYVRMSAGLSLKHSGNHPAIVAATAKCPIQSKLLPTDLLFRQGCLVISVGFTDDTFTIRHWRPFLLLLKPPHTMLLFDSKCLCVIQNRYTKHKRSV